VDALGGAPGVNSHRWLGPDASDQMLAEEIVRRTAEVPEGRRGARIRCALALAYQRNGEATEQVVEAAIEGVIAQEAYRPVRAGFPYRAVLDVTSRNWAKKRKRKLASAGPRSSVPASIWMKLPGCHALAKALYSSRRL
jgi:hypothetical protein